MGAAYLSTTIGLCAILYGGHMSAWLTHGFGPSMVPVAYAMMWVGIRELTPGIPRHSWVIGIGVAWCGLVLLPLLSEFEAFRLSIFSGIGCCYMISIAY